MPLERQKHATDFSAAARALRPPYRPANRRTQPNEDRAENPPATSRMPCKQPRQASISHLAPQHAPKLPRPSKSREAHPFLFQHPSCLFRENDGAFSRRMVPKISPCRRRSHPFYKVLYATRNLALATSVKRRRIYSYANCMQFVHFTVIFFIAYKLHITFRKKCVKLQ